MYRQRIQKAWGQPHGAPRLGPSPSRPHPGHHLIHGPAHRGANGTAMPTDEDDQDDHFLFNHPERGGNLVAA